MPKYEFVNGVMQLKGAPSATVVPLAVVATQEDIFEATQLQGAAGRTMTVPVATQVALDTFEKPEFVARFKTKDLDGEKVLEDLGRLFSQYEVPVGLLSKLLTLADYKINVILDDSGSMGAPTDSTKSLAGNYMKAHYQSLGANPSEQMTRWEEEEDRLHIMLDFLAYIPTQTITISFMNRSNRILLTHDGKTPEQFAADAHAAIRSAFATAPGGGTPTMAKMREAFTYNAGSSASGPTMHYLFTDGVPNDCTTDDLGKFLANRANPKLNPLTFVSCTDQDHEAEWMKEIEEKGPFMAEVDDYSDEREEVMHDQGPAFPYTKGLWLMCLLVGAINPHDLDAMDDSRPFSKYTMDNVMGRVLTKEEYSKYWNSQPVHEKFDKNFKRFAEEPKSTLEMFGELSEADAKMLKEFADSKAKTSVRKSLTSGFRSMFKP